MEPILNHSMGHWYRVVAGYADALLLCVGECNKALACSRFFPQRCPAHAPSLPSWPGDLNPMVPGRKVAAIFGFCDIRSFTGGFHCLLDALSWLTVEHLLHALSWLLHLAFWFGVGGCDIPPCVFPLCCPAQTPPRFCRRMSWSL